MGDDIDGAAQEQGLDQPQNGAQDAEGAQGTEGAAQGRQVSGAGKEPDTAAEYRKALAAKDAEIEAVDMWTVRSSTGGVVRTLSSV